MQNTTFKKVQLIEPDANSLFFLDGTQNLPDLTMPPKKKKGKAPLMPKGTGAIKRTPSTHFDEVSGDQLWKPEEVQGEKQAVNRCPCSLCKGNKGKTERYYLIKWKDHDKKHNTWECAAHIAGNEQLVKAPGLYLIGEHSRGEEGMGTGGVAGAMGKRFQAKSTARATARITAATASI